MHREPSGRFFVRHGFFQPLCRAHPVPRFRCRGCGRTFSRQTFRQDYRDRRPDLNAVAFQLLTSGLGLRRTARLLQIQPDNLAAKARKAAEQCRLLHRNVACPLPRDSSLQLDEFETYEGRRSTRPLTLPMLIEKRSRLILAARSAPIRPGGAKPAKRLRAIADDERRFGRRQSRSQAAVRSVLRAGAAVCQNLSLVPLETDEKSSYRSLAKEVFGPRVIHTTTSSRLPRKSWNPLFPINHGEAVARCLMGRLRRRSWLVSKRRWYLNGHLYLYIVSRNLVWPRFNRDHESPAQLAGWLPRRLRPWQVLSWRQDFGDASGHPLSVSGRPWVAVRAA